MNELSLFRIDLYSRQPHVLKDFYEEALGLRLTHTTDGGSTYELSGGRMQLVITRSVHEVKNRVRICFQTPDFKNYKQLLTIKNIPITATKVKEGRFFFELKDPDGNEVAVYQV